MLNGLDLPRMLNGLDLFSGIGGLTLALNNWVRPVAYCEIDPYCQAVLLSRQASGDIQRAPIWDDVRTFPTKGLREFVDVVYGGFPCQDISIAGHGKGLEGERSGLFFEVLRVAEEIKPSFIFLENVPAITGRGGITVVREIAALGYDCRWCVTSAASVGAFHKRDRWFLLAHNGNSLRKSGKQANKISEPKSSEEKTWRRSTGQYWPFESRADWQETVSSMGKCSDGLPYQSHRLRALGNAVVPQQAKRAFEILMGI